MTTCSEAPGASGTITRVDDGAITTEWPGYCSICERNVVFTSHGPWHRDHLVCESCGSIPRQRALVTVLSIVRPEWRRLRMWELAPAGPASVKLQRENDACIASHFWPGLEPGSVVDGVRCEDLEHPTFDDASVDVVVSSDVFEHVVDVDVALAQIARVLADGGIHVWTTPQYPQREVSEPRVRRVGGSLEYLRPLEYHGDPVDPNGSLVTYDWGLDLPERVETASAMSTTVFRIQSRDHGLLGEFLEVFVSRKGAGSVAAADQTAAWTRAVEEIDALSQEIGVLSLQIEVLSDAVAASRQTTEAMASSRSWRMTEPLRRLAGAMRSGTSAGR
jgi:SAM-dependent methyltransferase